MGKVVALCFLFAVAAISDGTRQFYNGIKGGDILERELDRLSERTSSCNDDSIYRSMDGVCNNLGNPGWGAVLQTLRRIVDAEYDDDVGKPRVYAGGPTQLPSARKVSVECFDRSETEVKDEILSQFMMQWGQFMIHDVVRTEEGHSSDCCADLNSDGIHPHYNSTEGLCFPIQIPDNDAKFSDCMEFVRSFKAPQETEQREQVNMVTTYIDGSSVYGSSEEELDGLRDASTGLMILSNGNLLPTSNGTSCFQEDEHLCFDAGDIRVTDQSALMSMHTVWVREHNRIVGKLAEVNTGWDAERLFQEARKIISACLQRITYSEYLPKLIGQGVYDFFGLSDDYTYDPTVNVGVINAFATAAFRNGHSTLPGFFDVKDATEPLVNLFLEMSFVEEGIDDIMKGLLGNKNFKVDTFITESIGERLFENMTGSGESFDLMARNIQRGRDHGLPFYDKFVEWTQTLGSSLAGSVVIPACADGLYSNTSQVDLFLGGIGETPLTGAMIGPTFAFIIGKQFQDIRNGDRFWYETDNTTTGFSSDQLTEIKKVTLARVLCDNLNINEIQEDAFEVPATGNEKVNCNTIPSINFTMWAE